MSREAKIAKDRAERVFKRGVRSFSKRTVKTSLHMEQTIRLAKVAKASAAMLAVEAAGDIDDDDDRPKTAEEEEEARKEAQRKKIMGEEADSDEDSEEENLVEQDAGKAGGGGDDGGDGGDEQAEAAAAKATASKNRDFTNGSWIYRLERAFQHFQILAVIFEIDGVVWPANFRRLFYGWSYGFLHFHTKPFLNAFETLQTFTAGLPVVSEFLFFGLARHQHVVMYVLRLFFPILFVWATFRLWPINDYTDPRVTERWLTLWVRRWWLLGVPYSLGALSMCCAGVAICASPVYVLWALNPNRENPKPSGGMVVVGSAAFAAAWLVYFVCNTLWRSFFLRKTQHNREYSSIVMLKTTVFRKVQFCLVVLYLT